MKYAQLVLPDLAPLLKLDARLFQARMAVWSVMWEHEAPCTDAQALRLLGWNERGWRSARTQLLEAKLLRRVVGGYSIPTDEAELLASAQTREAQLRGKLAKGTSREGRPFTPTERGRLNREIERLAGMPHQFRHQADLFDDDEPPVSSNVGKKGNEFNAPSRAREEAPGDDETDEFGQSLGKVSRNIGETYGKHSPNPARKANDFNGSSHTQARAGTRAVKVKSKEKEPPCVPPDENGAEFDIPKRRREPGVPIPASWQPTDAQLSEAVASMIAQWPDGELKREGVKFVEDAHSNDRRHRNWDRAFGVWLTKHDGYLHERRNRSDKPSGWRDA